MTGAVGSPRRASGGWQWLGTRAARYSLPGAGLALVFGCLSFTPSLVPRTWAVQGIVVGLSAAVGYGVGSFLGWLARGLTARRLPPALLRRGWALLAVGAVPLVGWSLWQGQRWQVEIHRLTGVHAPLSYAWIRILLLAVALLLAVIAVARALRWLVGLVSGWLVRIVPARLAGPVAAILVVVLGVELGNGVILRGLVAAASSVSGAANASTDRGIVAPRRAERSGSPGSLVSWISLGRQGRDFVARGPDTARLEAFSGVPAKEPVRAYVGLRSAPTTAARTALAVRELRRAGGFDRAVLVVATTTGTGLVDESAAEAIEYMYNGDTAIVGVQYSFLPSFLSLLVDHQQAQEAGRELFNRVYDAWAARPPGHRPLLLVTGTSLGEFGSEAAFSGLADIRNRTDGVVWAGPPHTSELHQALVTQRDPQSPEWLPVYDGGRTVRFAARPSDLWKPGPVWPRPRVVYLQYGSDAVVRWSPELLFDKPDWLSEPRPPDVSRDMVWIPIVTFWQVTADLPSTYAVPPGHGHRYRGLYADAWAAVAPPPGWTRQDTRRLRRVLARSPATGQPASTLAGDPGATRSGP